MPALVSVLLAALASLARKLFVTALVEKLLASVMFIGLFYFAKRSTNMIDDQLVHDAYFAYYGKPYPEPQEATVEPALVPSNAIVLPSDNSYRNKAPVSLGDAIEEPVQGELLPKQLTDQ